MKNWEEARLLTDVLDRHVERIVQATRATDWTIYWAIPPFLRLIDEEPILSRIVEDYLEEVDRAVRTRHRVCHRLATEAAELLSKYRTAVAGVKEGIPPERAQGLGIEALPETLAAVTSDPTDHERLRQALEAVHLWVGFGYDQVAERWRAPELVEARLRIGRFT